MGGLPSEELGHTTTVIFDRAGKLKVLSVRYELKKEKRRIAQPLLSVSTALVQSRLRHAVPSRNLSCFPPHPQLKIPCLHHHPRISDTISSL
jgi:hypothetical protein